MNSPWAWAACHSGSWIYQQNQYMWVPGQIMHHQPPVRWIRSGGKVGWVPIHPSDVKGKLPINAQHGVFTVTNKSRLTLDRAPFNTPATSSSSTRPRENSARPTRPSSRACDAPRMEAHMIRPALQNAGPATAGPNKPGAVNSAHSGQAHSGPVPSRPVSTTRAAPAAGNSHRLRSRLAELHDVPAGRPGRHRQDSQRARRLLPGPLRRLLWRPSRLPGRRRRLPKWRRL